MRTRAAAPATSGEDADVPANADGHEEKPPYVAPDTLSWPTMSGFTRPSMVGPCELYGSSARDCQHSAPTARVAGEEAGAAMLPAATPPIRWTSKNWAQR